MRRCFLTKVRRFLLPGMSNFSPRENRFLEISPRKYGREILENMEGKILDIPVYYSPVIFMLFSVDLFDF